MPQDIGHDSAFPIVYIPPTTPIDNERSLDVGGNRIAMPIVQPVDNSSEDDITLPVIELREINSLEDEQDIGLGTPVAIIPPVQPVESDPRKRKILPLSGKLITSEDPVAIGDNFRTYKNFRPTATHPKAIGGMSKVNSANPMDATYLKARSAYHLVKNQPAETHVLVQAYNTGLTASQVLDNTTAIGTVGDFAATEVWNDTGTVEYAKWSEATEGQVVYCNGTDTCIWGGNEFRCARYLNFDTSNTFLYDFTDYITNTKTTEVATFTADVGGGGTGGDDANNALLLHLDNNVTDETGKTVTNANVTFTTSFKFGTHAAIFNGTTAYLTVPDHADFDCSDGTWTADFWVKFPYNDATYTDYSFYYQEIPVTKIIFSTGSHEPTVSETVNQLTSGATGIIKSVTLDTGTWVGGNAAGTIWLSSVTGTWTDGNNMIESADQLAGSGAFTGGTVGWTLAAGWTYGTDNVLKDGDGTGTLSKDTFAAVAGQIYRVTYTISSLTVGNVTASLGGASGTLRSADGTYTDTITAVSTAGLAFTPSNTARFTIDTVTVNITIATCTTCSTDVEFFHIRGALVSPTSDHHHVLSVTRRAAGVSTDLATQLANITSGVWHHLEFAENGDTWYIFQDGTLIVSATSASRAENYTSTVFIGNNNSTVFLKADIDEYRISKTTRHTASFSPSSNAYLVVGGSGSTGNIYVGSLRPLKGIKFYIGTANDQTATTVISYWDGTGWVSVSSLNDGTAATGKTMAQTGTISFTSTVSTAKPKYIDGTYIYFYRISCLGINVATTVYYVTLDAPFQRIVDIWDGIERNIAICYLYKDNYIDYTINAYTNYYDSSDASTFIELDSLTASTQYLVLGFLERMTAINILTAPSPSVNSTTSILSVYYWNGAEWTSVGTIEDGTAEGTISLAKSGVISWSPLAESVEFKKSISNGIPLYYYKLVWSATLDADVQVYFITGIPTQTTIDNYGFPLYTHNRLLLCNDTNGKRNIARYSSADSSQVFNGDDSGEIEFGSGTALNCGCSLFTQFGSNLYNLSILFKDTEIWALTYIEDKWKRYKIADTVGCPSPLTLRTTIFQPNALTKEMGASLNRYIAIWQGHNGIYITDGRAPILISRDISDRFDKTSSTCINTAYVRKSYGFMDELKHEYHWLYCNGTPGDATSPLNKEMVFSLLEWKWYEVDRTTGKYLQCGLTVQDTYGNALTHGFIDTGYMEALEWLNVSAGTIKTFDGTDITCTLETSDMAMTEGGFFVETRVLGSMLMQLAKLTTVNTATLTHYVDTSTTAVTSAFDPTKANYRISFPFKAELSIPAVLHSFKLVMIANDEAIAFEPLALNISYVDVRDRDYDRNW